MSAPECPAGDGSVESDTTSCVIDLGAVAPIEECAETDNGEPGLAKEQSEYDLLHELSASAIESGQGYPLGEPCCYLHVFGFKSSEMETTYSAFHAPTALRGHFVFAIMNAIYLIIRSSNLIRGVNYMYASVLTTYFLFTLGMVTVLSTTCCVYFRGNAVKLQQSLARMSNIIGLLAFSGWIAQYIDLFHFQTDWEDIDIAAVFHVAYFAGALSMIGSTYCLVILRMPFHLCAAAHLANSSVLLSSSYATKGEYMVTYIAMPLLQVMMLYSVENASRLTFVSEMQSAKMAADIRKAASDAEASAFQAINHCAKRVMYNTVQACSDLKRDTIPKLLATSSDTVPVRQLAEIVECIETDCQEGFGKCRDAIALKQLYSGDYQPVYEPVCIRTFLTETWGRIPKLTIVVDEFVPEWLSISVPLFLIIMQNAVHNAKTHGKRNGVLHLTLKLIEVGKDLFLQIYLRNEPGKNHDSAIQMQSELGENMLIRSKHSLGKIGSAMSTFLGMAEIQTAADAMSATINLVFHSDTEAEPGCVVFMSQLPLIVANDPGSDDSTPLKLRDGTFLICADDDKIARMMYKSLSKKCGATECCVLGVTFDEADSIASTVKKVAAEHGDANVVVLLDQNMDNYKEGKIMGTDVTAELRADGFKGIIFIRSANDDAASANHYRRAGANGCIGKKLRTSALVGDIVKQCNLAWEMVTITK